MSAANVTVNAPNSITIVQSPPKTVVVVKPGQQGPKGDPGTSGGTASRRVLSGAQTLTTNDGIVLYNGSGGDSWVLPPTSASLQQLVIKNASVGVLILNASGTDQVEFASSIQLPAQAAVNLFSTNGAWYVY